MSFPDVSDAFWNWTTPVLFQTVVQTIVDYQAVETPGSRVTFEGTLQPIPPQKLFVKPEGQRAWKWWYLWTPYVLAVNQIVIDPDGKEYRVMQASDWRNGGHLQYELVQDPPISA